MDDDGRCTARVISSKYYRLNVYARDAAVVSLVGVRTASLTLPYSGKVLRAWRCFNMLDAIANSRVFAIPLLHCDGDLPAVERVDGTREWWWHGKRHRVTSADLPAVDGPGGREWWRLGHLHRGEDKPAVEYADSRREWWINGQRMPSSAGGK